MKKVFILSLLFVFTMQSYAQHAGNCGFIAGEDFIGRTLSNKKHYHKHLGENRSPTVRYVPINFLVGGKTDQSQTAANPENVLEMMCRLNEAYEEVNIQFYIYDRIKYIYNDAFYDNPGIVSNLIVNPHRKLEAMDVLIGRKADTPGGGLGVTLGHYNPSKDWIVIKTSEINYASETFPHEVGHYFSLNHPHYGWDADPWDEAIHGNPVTLSSSPSNPLIPIELANGSNCETSGDFLCDTPADYNLGFGWNNCNYTGGARDPEGVLLDPEERNFMGYFLECGNDYHFSDEQIALVNADLDIRQGVLDTDFTPNATTITGMGSPIFPTDNEVLDYYNNFAIKWNFPEGGLRSVVQISENFLFLNSIFYGIKSSNGFWVGEDLLEPNKTYYVRVVPFNDYYTCTTGLEFSWSFKTGLNTNTSNLPLDLDWSVFPNPAAQGSKVLVQMDMEKSADVQVELLDLSGRVLYSQESFINAGQSNLELNHNDLSTGLYFVRLNTEDGVAVKKLIVQ